MRNPKIRRDRKNNVICRRRMPAAAVVLAVVMMFGGCTPRGHTMESADILGREAVPKEAKRLSGGSGQEAEEEKQEDREACKEYAENQDKDLDHQLQTAVVLFSDSTDMLANGERKAAMHTMLVENGLFYVPVNGVAEYMGASLAEYEQMLYISSQGVLSVIAEPYNIALTGTTAEILRGCVMKREGCYYVPAQNLAALLHVPVVCSILQGTVIVGGLGEFTEEDIRKIRYEFGLEERKTTIAEELEKACGSQKAPMWQCLEALNRGCLYRTDMDGRIGRWELLADGSMRWEHMELDMRYEPNRLYMAGRESRSRQLYLAGKESDAVGWIPELQQEEELREEVKGRIEEKAARELSVYFHGFKKVQKEESDKLWEQLEKEAQPGDILLFHNPSSAARYGYLNHSALILEKSEQGLHLLQARGSEDGVGAEKEMDWLSYEKFHEKGYWQGNEVILLGRVEDAPRDVRNKLAREAPDFYKGYQFGYGSFRGQKETNCAELISETYDRAGIPILEEKGSRLRMLLEGKAKNLVVLPDDLALSDKLKIRAFWLAEEEEAGR